MDVDLWTQRLTLRGEIAADQRFVAADVGLQATLIRHHSFQWLVFGSGATQDTALGAHLGTAIRWDGGPFRGEVRAEAIRLEENYLPHPFDAAYDLTRFSPRQGRAGFGGRGSLYLGYKGLVLRASATAAADRPTQFSLHARYHVDKLSVGATLASARHRTCF